MAQRVIRFTATLSRFPGKGGWTFAPVPDRLAPPATRDWGRTPVLAIVEGRSWRTSVWRSRTGGSMLPIPKNIRGARGHGDTVHVELRLDPED